MSYQCIYIFLSSIGGHALAATVIRSLSSGSDASDHKLMSLTLQSAAPRLYALRIRSRNNSALVITYVWNLDLDRITTTL